METTNLPSPSERLEHYEKAIEYLQDNKGYDDYGLCVILGDIAYESVFKAPWDSFEHLQVYYPELTEPKSSCILHVDWTPYTDDVDVSAVLEAVKERIGILERAIEQLIKK